MQLKGKTVGILVGPGYEDLEFWVPYMRMLEEGAEVKVIAAGSGETYTSKSGGLTVASQVAAGDIGADQLDALLVPGEQPVVVELPRLQTTNTHGTGCSFSAAIATCQARNGDWAQSLAEATDWLHTAVARGAELRVGSGLGPVHHFHRVWG